jgi:hypothetical protein
MKTVKNTNMTFRARKDMRDGLAALALNNNRSISEEIEYRLEASFRHEAAIAAMNRRILDLEEAAKGDRETIQRLTMMLMEAQRGRPTPHPEEQEQMRRSARESLMAAAALKSPDDDELRMMQELQKMSERLKQLVKEEEKS